MTTVFLSIFVLLITYLIIVLGYRLVWRDAGIISLAHAAFCGVGAYTAAIITKHLAPNAQVINIFPETIIALVGSALVTMIVASFSGLLLIRIRGDYFVLLTLAFGESLRNFAANSPTLGGNLGLKAIPEPTLAGASGTKSLLILALSVLIVLLVLSNRLYNSRLGLDLHTVRDDERLAYVVGLRDVELKWKSFVIGSGIAGVGGGILALHFGYIDPTLFGINEVVLLLTLTALSVSGSPNTTVITASLFLLVYLLLPWLPLSPSVVGPTQQLLLGTTIIAIALFSKMKRKT